MNDQSPLTQSVMKPYDKNSAYWGDETGTLYLKDFDPKEWATVMYPGFPDVPLIRDATAEEKAADEWLASALHKKYIKKDSGILGDIFNKTTTLRDAFRSLGYEAYDSIDSVTKNKVKFDLLTFVHTFHKLPVQVAKEMLEGAAKDLSPEGLVFIRIPDPEVDGFVPSGLTCWTLYGMLELLHSIGNLRIVDTYTVRPGQRDYFLKVFPDRPKICVGMIAKNEERDLPKCLESLRGVADGLVLLDTGSKDRTIEIARSTDIVPSANIYVDTYLGASEQDPNDPTNYQLWDFGKARNEYCRRIEEGVAGQYDYILWMDADDILESKMLKNLPYLDSIGMHGITMTTPGTRWIHHRLWKTSLKVRYRGRCHEYPDWGNAPSMNHDRISIFHDGAAGVGESSNQRNLRILLKEFEEAPTSRNAFYLANTHKDGGRYAEAVPVYRKRMEFGKGFEEEYWFAALYMARCQRLAGDLEGAAKTVRSALAEKPDWAEFIMEMAYIESTRRNYKKALGWCLLAQDSPVVPSSLFRERDKYTDQPYRYASWVSTYAGNPQAALQYALEARSRIGNYDKDWEDRIKKLQGQCGLRKKVLWYRPGALGDVLMTLNLVKPYLEQNPDVDIVYKCAAGIKVALEEIMLEAGISEVIDLDAKDPYEFQKVYSLVGYPLHEGYPDKPMNRHLLEYFATELGIDNTAWDNISGFEIQEAPVATAKRYMTIHIKAGWSPYKNWSHEKWETICEEFAKHIDIVQIGGPDDPVLRNATHSLLGKPFSENLKAIGGAMFHLGIDSWSNHATNIFWKGKKTKTPAVILWGSTQATSAGYPQNKNISKGLQCQPCFREDPKISRMSKGPCPHAGNDQYQNPQHPCMMQIEVEEVVDALGEIFS